MIAEKLRKSILQAAIQGKLTEQLPEDGDARELLAEIKAEKARLVKEGKIKKEKPLPEITEDEIPFDIPEGWAWVRLGEVITVRGGKRLPEGKKLTQTKTNHIYIRVTDMKNGSIDSNDLHYITDDVREKIKDYIITTDDLYIVIVGSTIGKVGLVPEVFNNMNLTENAARLIPYRVNKKYLLNILMSKLLQEQFFEKTKQVGQPKLALARLKSAVIPVPSIAEQKRIVDKIEELISKISLLKKDELKLQLLQKSFPKKMKDSLLQAAIQGKLTEQLESDGDARALVADIQEEKARLIKEGKIKQEKALPEITEEEIPFEIPDNWCWVRLGEVTDYGTGRQVNQNNIAPNSWILELEDIEKETYKLSSKRFDRKPRSSKNAFTTGEVLYGKLRPYLKKVIIADGSGYCSTEIIPFRGYGNISSSYLKYCMVCPAIDSYINQITHGMDMPRLGTDKAKQLVIPLPPLDEQQRIVARLELLLPLCDALE